MFATVSTKCSLTCSAPVNFWQDVQKYNFSICYSFVKISVPLTPARALETQSKSNSLLKFHKHCMQMPFGREFQNRQELQHHTYIYSNMNQIRILSRLNGFQCCFGCFYVSTILKRAPILPSPNKLLSESNYRAS